MEPKKTNKQSCQAKEIDGTMACKKCKYIWSPECKAPRCKSQMSESRRKKLPVVIFGLDRL